MEPRRRPGTNLEHAASSHARSHFNPDYRPRSKAPLLPPLAPILILYFLMLFSLDLKGIFFFLFSVMEPKRFNSLAGGKAGPDYFIFYRWL
jgi:hypothetical protein